MGKGFGSGKKKDMKYFSDRWLGDAIYTELEVKETFLAFTVMGVIGECLYCQRNMMECPPQAKYTAVWKKYKEFFENVTDADVAYLVSEGEEALKDFFWKFRNLGKKSSLLEQQVEQLIRQCL